MEILACFLASLLNLDMALAAWQSCLLIASLADLVQHSVVLHLLARTRDTQDQVARCPMDDHQELALLAPDNDDQAAHENHHHPLA